ncbi:MAG: 6-phosphogluconolactonase [Actinomycetota bacterium]|nr:6-phosphogluconolactonase [Actinomycetota bacterium]
MTGSTEIVVHPNADLLAAAAAARLIGKLVDVQAVGRIPAVALTGGGAGIATLAQLNVSAARDAVDWSRVEIYWGDERFVPAADPDRNAGQARTALLDHVPLDPARVHEMAASDGEFGDDVDAAAAAYVATLPAALDLVLLGMGPEGHAASVFPHSPALTDNRPVVAVRDCPKPPPTRISLTLPTIRTADEVWMLVGGAEKSEAVASALAGAAEEDVPVAGATGRSVTRWLLDPGSASKLPGRGGAGSAPAG